MNAKSEKSGKVDKVEKKDKVKEEKDISLGLELKDKVHELNLIVVNRDEDCSPMNGDFCILRDLKSKSTNNYRFEIR